MQLEPAASATQLPASLHAPAQQSESRKHFPSNCGVQAHAPVVHSKLQQSPPAPHVDPLPPQEAWQVWVPELHSPLQQSDVDWQAPPGGAQTQTPLEHRPLQQLASWVQSEFTSLQKAHIPLAQLPLQHWELFWQFEKPSLHLHVPPTQAPLQQAFEEQLCPSSAQPPTSVVPLPPELVVEAPVVEPTPGVVPLEVVPLEPEPAGEWEQAASPSRATAIIGSRDTRSSAARWRTLVDDGPGPTSGRRQSEDFGRHPSRRASLREAAEGLRARR